MRRIKLTIEYDGSRYVGWQIQPNGISIQQVLQSAITQLFNSDIPAIASGRTDSGVHALGQVIHFDCPNNLPPFKIIRGLNFYLPDDIRVINAEEIHSEFHARYDAVNRIYRYYIRRQPSAVHRYFRWVLLENLDVAEMKKAASCLLGTKNFKSFCSTQSDTENYVCQITKAELSVVAPDLIFEIHGNRFLHNMVRAIVGTLVEIGRGKIRAGDMERIIAAENRNAAGATAPPTGLFLEKVFYR